MTKYFLIYLLFFANFSKSQFFENHAIYLSYGPSIGNYAGSHIGLNYIYKEKFTFLASSSLLSRRSITCPDDFDGGLSVNVLWLEMGAPSEFFRSNYLMAGYVKPINLRKTIRLNFKAGIASTRIIEPTNYVKIIGPYQNYNYDLYESKPISFVLSAGIEFPFYRGFGFAVEPYLFINDKRVATGISLHLIFGMLRGKTIPKVEK